MVDDVSVLVRLQSMHLYPSFFAPLLKPDQGLAISGGVDSMALATLCHDVVNEKSTVMAPLFAFDNYPRTQASFTAFIVNHKLRENSGVEAERVAEELAKMDIESQILELDWSLYGNPKTLNNVESIARTLRYQVLGIACAKRDINTLLLAHHANDQAETAMARIVNNYVGLGLGAMRLTASIPECTGIYGVDQSGLEQAERPHVARTPSSLPIERGGVTVARPLLPFQKWQLVELCQQSNVRWFQDHTNADRTLTVRNTVRFLQLNDVLPLALRTSRLIDTVRRVGKRRAEDETLADEIFLAVPLALSLRTGEASIPAPQVSSRDGFETLTIQAYVLRRMLELVSPKHVISLQQLHAAIDFVFHGKSTKERHGSDVGEEKYHIAGICIRRKIRRGSEDLDSSVLTLHRALPTAVEKRELQVQLWPPSIKNDHLEDKQGPTWRLWDGRYWIRVLPPNARVDSYTEIIVRFLKKDDMAGLRKSLPPKDRRRLDEALALAKGDVRYTLPAIVAKQSPVSGDRCSATEQVVALPSLNRSFSGWARASVQSTDNSWRWDIRYKHVKLNRRGPHSVVS